MRLARLAWQYLWARPLAAVLNLALLALGVGTLSFVLLAGEQLERTAQRDLAGIDLVVGAKGSPLQLMLAAVFQLDVPSGNIPLATVATLRKERIVAKVVPLAMGDSLRGWRIVGSEPTYLDLYNARLAEGRVWAQPMEAVLGAEVARDTALGLGARFEGTHGLGQGGDVHAGAPYTVVGRLARCGCVLDRLVLTALESVWAVHDHGDTPAGSRSDAQGASQGAEPKVERKAGPQVDRKHDHKDDPKDDPKDSPKDEPKASPVVAQGDRLEITSLLVRYASPLAAVSLPRWVNAQAGLQAAAPALESARLLRIVGAGTEVLRGFGLLLTAVAALSVFIALYHAVREREGDLAMLRLLGASPGRVAALVAWEAMWLALLGIALGLALGHGLVHALGLMLARERSITLTGAWFSQAEGLIVAGTLLLALLAAVLPARRALKVDVTRLLQGG